MPEPTTDDLGLNTHPDFEFPKNEHHPDKVFTEPDQPLEQATASEVKDKNERPNKGKYLAG
jgi:hypothetical protein